MPNTFDMPQSPSPKVVMEILIPEIQDESLWFLHLADSSDMYLINQKLIRNVKS